MGGLHDNNLLTYSIIHGNLHDFNLVTYGIIQGDLIINLLTYGIIHGDLHDINGIRHCLIGVGLNTEVKQRRALFRVGWVAAWDCQVPYTPGHRAVIGAQRTT